MKQEQKISKHSFLKEGYASVKIKMEPQSLILDIPLDWQINKIKCLLVKMMIKLEFDMFQFHHDNQEIPGEMTLGEVIERDNDEQCIGADHYVLTFVKFPVKKQQFEKYYISKMKPLVGSLENSPFQPILHPGYYGLKYLHHINHIPFEGGRELIVNFNQLQQMQNVIQEQRRQNENIQGDFIGAQWGGQMGEENGGIMNQLGRGFIRFIQIISIISIGKFLLSNSGIEVFIIMAFLCLTYFAIDFMKKKEKIPVQQQEQQKAPTQKVIQGVEESTILVKMFYRLLILIVETFCLMIEGVLSYFLSLFPNWTVESHLQWFKSIHQQIDQKLSQWKIITAPIMSEKNENVEPSPTSSFQQEERSSVEQKIQGEDEVREQMRKQHEQ